MLFPYQKVGAEWLSSQRLALLADEMGLGKSAQAITAADFVQAERVLVLCPAIARFNWEREFRKFAFHPRRFEVLQSSKDISRLESISGKSEAPTSIICSYDLAGKLPPTFTFDVLICDESHYLKNHRAQRTHTVFSNGGLVRRAKRTWCLTGTPMPNHAGDLWVLLFSFGKTKLSYEDFISKYCHCYDGPYGRVVTGTKQSMFQELRELLSPIMLRRKKEEVMTELPPLIYSEMIVERTPVDLEQMPSFAHYFWPTDRSQELKQELHKQLNMLTTVCDGMDFKKERNSQSAALLQTLEAMAGSIATLRRYTGLQKMQNVGRLVEMELAEQKYDKIVIFAIHADVIDGLKNMLRRYGAVVLYGKTDPERRTRNIDKFQNDPKCKVIICNVQAAGTAVNLTASHQVLLAESSWSPAENAQAICRCHRIGATEPVHVRFVSLFDSIDEKIVTAIKAKTKAITEVMDYKVKRVNSSLLTNDGVKDQVSRHPKRVSEARRLLNKIIDK